MKKDNIILNKSFEFALDIIECYKHLKNNHEYILSQQLLKAGTSIGANVNEAQAAQSKKDFISKMSIASKEARETEYWLKLLKKSQLLVDYSKGEKLLDDINNLISIITKIVKTSIENNKY
ncbi:MAG: four helix bundle protein [Candidatus Marinimicrobia bacterium]|nr:four helix bundle protein [Candidatus Neomarinimicrobiota bacterium]